MTDIPTKFAIKLFGLSLSAEGVVALALAVPISVVLIALAYQIFRMG